MTTITLNHIPPYWAPQVCAEDACLNTATVTACDDPDRCTNDTCHQLVACDDHAQLLGEAVYQLINGRGEFSVTPSREYYGSHD